MKAHAWSCVCQKSAVATESTAAKTERRTRKRPYSHTATAAMTGGGGRGRDPGLGDIDTEQRGRVEARDPTLQPQPL